MASSMNAVKNSNNSITVDGSFPNLCIISTTGLSHAATCNARSASAVDSCIRIALDPAGAEDWASVERELSSESRSGKICGSGMSLRS